MADPNASCTLRLRASLLKKPLIRNVVSRWGSDLNPSRWIFVIGCYNSGTTLLSRILSRHPSIEALPSEGVRFTDVLPRPEQFGWNRMWCRCKDQVRLSGPKGSLEVADRIKRHWSLVYPSNAENLLEKSVANTARIPFLTRYFRPAFFIYIIRNGYAVAEGIQRKARPGKWGNDVYTDRYPIELCAEQWRVSDETVDSDRGVADNFLRIRYEDLTENPHDVIAQVIDFLQL